MLKLVCSIFLSLCIAGVSHAQNAVRIDSSSVGIRPPVKRVVPKKPKFIRAELSGGLRLNSNGWSVFVDKGWVKGEDKRRDYFYDVKLLQVEFGEKKHLKELKRSNNIAAVGDRESKPFIFGKINNFYDFKIGYGARKMIAGKPENGNISIHWVYLGGLTLGMQKPYYIEAVVRDNGAWTTKSLKYTDETENVFLNGSAIIGSSGIMKGLNEIQFIPGIHAKTALHFDFAANKKTKMAVETGLNAEYYTKNVELMATQKAVPYLVDVYLSFQFGGRW
jgi:hypothetical protein